MYDSRIELEALGIEYVMRENNTLRIRCPFHDDNTPSCDIFADGMYKCYACGASGSLVRLIARVSKRPQSLVQSELDARYGTSEKPVSADQIERSHAAIWHASVKDMREELYRRAISDETIRKYRLGFDAHSGRITIPITNPSGQFVNVRRYLPGGKPKFTSMRGRNKRQRIYPFEQLRYKSIVICGGEIKALACAQALNKYDIGAVCLSGMGEERWETALEQFFAHKRVAVCNDIDDVGMRASEHQCIRLQHVAEIVKMIVLPLDRELYPKGDINDYLYVNSPEQLLELLKETPEFEATLEIVTNVAEALVDPENVLITDINSSRFVNKRIACNCTVAAMDQNIYYVPKVFEIECNRDQEYCAACPVFLSANAEFRVGPENPMLLSIADSKKATIREELYTFFKIPLNCKVSTIAVRENFKLVETRVQRELDLSDHQSDKLMLPAVIVDTDIDLNETYRIIGKPVPHPKTQAATILVSEVDRIADALSTFDAGDTTELAVFQPSEWSVEAIEAKLSTIYKIYENNVTRIYDRPSLHKFVDLVFHSVLSFDVEGSSIKGWLELLVIGDSSQGKSEALKKLCEFYHLGASVDCKNATTAGLLGGLEQIGGKWFAQWGIIPKHDRRLVVLEELKGLRPEVFARLTDMRSSGIAEIPKIQHRRAQARTRLIALTNPYGSQIMSAYAHGIRAIQDIVKNPEDVRRFDAAIVLNKNEIKAADLNTPRDRVESFFDKELARRLVLWAWTRKHDDVVILPETYQRALEVTRELCDTFSDNIPLIDRGSTRFKLLRFAAALACRTFSVADATDTETHDKLIVRPCHVDYVAKMLVDEYDKKENGYKEFSTYEKKSAGEINARAVVEEFKRTPYAEYLAQQLLITHEIELQDFCDWCAWSRDQALMFLSAMVRANALRRAGGNNSKLYNKLPQVMDILRGIVDGSIPVGAPKHIEENIY